MKKYLAEQFGNPNGFGGIISTHIMNFINQSMYNHCKMEMQTNKTSNTILDIGFGNGYMLQKLAHSTSHKLYGIDISEDMVNLALKKLKNKAIIKTGDVSNLDYSDHYFDAVYTINTFYFWPDPAQALREIYRVLKPDSSFYNFIYTKEKLDQICFTNTGFRKSTMNEILQIHKNTEFKQIELIEIKKNKSYYLKCTK